MQHTRRKPLGRAFQWALVASVLAAAAAFLTTPAMAGPKGMIIVRPLGNAKITIDGNISDWPLDKFTMVAGQPPFPDGQNKDSTTAMGDHVVFDVKRVGFFNDTKEGEFTKNANDFGSSLYFAYDPKFLYILDVCIDDVLRDDKDTTDFGSEGFRNDGVEFLLDMKGNAAGCFDSSTYPSEVQVAVSLNKNFKPKNSPDDVLGARQVVLSNGAAELLGAGGIWQAALDAIGGPDIAARRYADLRAAGARNPELAAKPNVKFSGYVIEMRVPFNTGATGIPDFTPDHNMGFEMWWRDVDNGDMDPSSDPGAGQLDESWATWTQATTVPCDADPKTSLYNTSNWGTLVFDKADALGQ